MADSSSTNTSLNASSNRLEPSGEEVAENTEVTVNQGEVYVVQPDGATQAVGAGETVKVASGQMLLADSNAKYVVMKNGEPVLVDWPCPTCVLIAPSSYTALSSDTNDSLEVFPESLVIQPLGQFSDEASFAQLGLSEQELAAIQEQILAGADPTDILAPPAAGSPASPSGSSGETANGGFVVINYDGDSTLAEAGFDTQFERGDIAADDDTPPLFAAAGGETGAMQLTEADFAPNTYPSEASTQVIVSAGSLPLDPDSFTFDPAQLADLLAELSAEVTSSGQPVVFSFDPSSNSIIGVSNGSPVVTFQVSAETGGRDATVTVTTLLERPIDHIPDTTSGGRITNIDDVLTVQLPLQGADLAGNPLDVPLQVSAAILDGDNPLFGIDEGTVIDEADSLGVDLTGKVPLDVGSDEISTLVFDPDQPDLEGLTSNGFETTVSINAGQLELVDSRGELVLTISIDTDGTYVVNLMQPLDQLNRAELVFELAVTATDFDGDSTDGLVVLVTIDGNSPPGGETGEITFVEPDLQPNDYPGSGQDTIELKPGVDRLDPDTVTIDELVLAELISELNRELSSGGDELTFSYDDATDVLTGVKPNGEVAVTLTLTSVQSADGLGITITAELVQLLPLDHLSSGNSDGFVSVNGEQIAVIVPIQANDTDGDFLDTAAILTTTIIDGNIPVLLEDNGIDINESADLNVPIGSQIGVDVGSDEIAAINFIPDQPGFNNLFSDGQPVQFDVVGGNTINAYIDVNGIREPVFTVVMTPTGEYTFTLNNNLDHIDSDEITLPLGVMVIDDDGDTNTGTISLTIRDGDDPEFGGDTGLALNEGEQGITSGTGNIEVITGSDDVVSVVFATDQPTLTGLTSNGFALTPAVIGNQITLVRSDDPSIVVLEVSIGIDGSYSVSQLQPLDQIDASDLNTFILGVVATDRDGDVAQSTITITIEDGTDPAGGNAGNIIFTEGDLTPEQSEEGYPVSGTHTLTIPAGVDRLDPDSFELDANQLASLLSELQDEVTAGGLAVIANWDENTGELTLTAGGEIVLTAVLTAVQNSDGEQVDIITEVTQFKPLDHNGTDNTGLVRQQNDSIVFDLPIQLQDTDGDFLENPAVLTATITDGNDPELEQGVGISLNETDNANQVVSGAIGIDVGSDEVASLLFADTQAVLNFTSDGNPVSLVVGGTPVGSEITLVDLLGNTILLVTINNDGTFEATLSGTLDHIGSDSLLIPLDVVITDEDDDQVSGQISITITDGVDPDGGDEIAVAIIEPDLDPNNYPETQQQSVTIAAGSDRLVPGSVQIDPSQLAAILAELNSELTSGGGEALTFNYDLATNEIVGSLADGTTVLTIEFTSVQAADGQGIDLTMTVTQLAPLDHNINGNNNGFVSISGTLISITLPLQAEDVDGDNFVTPVIATADISDGDIPAFGADSGADISDPDNTPPDQVNTATGAIALDVGSDAIASVVFVDTPGLSDLISGFTSNGEPVSYQVDQSQLQIFNSQNEAILTVTIANDGSYTVEQSDAFDQPLDSNQLQLVINVLVTDDDGDTDDSQIVLTLNDGSDPAGGGGVSVSMTEPDLDPNNYPESVEATLDIVAGADRLDPDSISIDPAQLADVIADLQSVLSSAGELLTVTFDEGSGLLEARLPDGSLVLTAAINSVQAVNGDDLVVSVITTQLQPLDHLDTTVDSPYITSNGEEIVLTLPLMATDTDGDDLAQPASVSVTIVDGEFPALGSGAGVSLNETSDANQVVEGAISIDKGSDDIASLFFANTQAALNFTSDGNPVSLEVGGTPAGSEITLVDSLGNIILLVTINTEGEFEATLSGTLDHLDSESLIIPLDVVITDDDGDQAPGQIAITITDGDDPAGGGAIEVDFTEPDLAPPSQAPSEYPLTEQQLQVIVAGSDRLVPESVQIDPDQLATIIAELNSELTSGGGEILTFSYDPNTNELIGALGDGTPVLTIVFTPLQSGNGQDIDLTMTVTQSAPLDHTVGGNSDGFVSVSGELITVNLPLQATDVDGDNLVTQVTAIASITDGPIPELVEGSSITVNETADLNVPIPGQVGVDVGSDEVASITFVADQPAFANLLSDGLPVQFEIVDGNTLNAFIDVNGNLQNVFTVVMTPSGDYTLTLNNNLDHLDGDNISLPLNVLVTDDDGDTNTGVVTLNIEDGDDPTFGNDSGLALNEGDDGISSGTANIEVIQGSDDVISVLFSAVQPALEALTSNGFALTFTVTGNQITVVRADDPNIVVLEISIDINGGYSVTQLQPLDQIDDSDLATLELAVEVTDRDSDTTQGSITVTIEDGTDPVGGNTAQIAFTEGDLTPDQGEPDNEQGYPVSGDAAITVASGVDRLDPDTVDLDSIQLATLLAELESEITAGGLPTTAVWDVNTGTLTLSAGGEAVLTTVITAAQNSDGEQVDITTTVTQLKPLDHNGTDNTGLVRQQDDTIVFDLPIQVQDTDGDFLETPALITTTITDGADPEIETIASVTVLESDIDEGGDFHPGSNPDGDGQTATGTITFDSGSDEIVNYEVDVDAFNTANADTLTAGGQQVTLVFNTTNNTYEGQVNGVVIFVLAFIATGTSADDSYNFTLLGALDHIQPDNDTELTIEFSATAVDQDGDASSAVTFAVTIEDDIPQTQDAAFQPIEEGESTETLDVLTVPEEGADDAEVTAVIIEGVRQELTGTPDAQGFFSFDVNQDGQLLGQLLISAEGQVLFNSLPNLDHGAEPIVANIDFEVTDGDSDLSQSTLTITITDEEPTLVVQPSEGVEDQGRNPDESLGDPTTGIPINMSIDIGDADRGEQIGDVFIILPSDPHGQFFLNGVEIVPAGGQVQIDPAAFVDPDGDGVFELQGVTFVPEPDYSTLFEPNNLLDFTVTAEVVTDDGVNQPLQDGTLSISVLGIADQPAFAETAVFYYGDGVEDGDNISLSESFQALLQDTDGSEELAYFITITEGQAQIIGEGIFEVEPGVFEVPISAIDIIEIDPIDNFSGDIRLTLTAQSTELGHFVPGSETAQISEEILVNVLPVADDAQLKVSRVESLEDDPIALAPLIELIELDDLDDDFGVETLFVRISELPDGAQLSQNGTVLTPDGDGVYEILYEELDQVELIPVPESNVDFQIKVEGVVKDVVDITLEDGTVETVEDVLVTPAQFIEVALTGVVDEPEFELGGSNWTEIVGSEVPGIETTVDEDTDAVLDFSLVSGEFANAPLDESETLTFVVSNIPEGTQIFDAEGNQQTLVFVGFDDDGLPRYEVKLTGEDIGDPDQPVAISIRPPENSTEDIVLDANIVVTENDGDQGEFVFQLVIHIEPVVDAEDYTRRSNGLEDEPINLNWQPVLTDSKEQITGLVVNNIQPDYGLQINDGGTITALTVDAAGSVTLTEAQLAQLLNGAQLQLLAPEDSDLNLTGATAINTQVTVTEVDVDSPATDVQVVNGTLNVIIQAVVEPDAEIGVIPAGSTDFVDTIVSNDGSLDLGGGDGSDGQIVFEDLDPSSDEIILSIVISFPDPEADFVVIGGINNGDGSWTVPQGSLDDIQILAPADFIGTVTVAIAAEVQDQSDDVDPSTVEIVNSTLTIDFQNNALNDQLAADIVVDDSIIVTGEEDTAVTLGTFLNQIVSLSTVGENQGDDEFSLVISAASLPNGATISGMDFNFVTGEYVIKVPVQGDGSVDLSGINLSLPQDFAGDFLLDVKYVNTDTASGDFNEVTDTIPVRIDPLVDVPEQTGDNERVPDIGVSVVETQGLDADRQPIEDGESEVIYPDIAYEDGTIILDVTATVADISTTTLEGLETIDQAVISVGASGGFLLNAAGEQVTSLTITGSSELSAVRYIPPQDFSGDVSLDVTVTIVDTAEYDETTGAAIQTDTANFDGSISFEVIAVNDEINFIGIETPVEGDEDSGSISFAGISGNVVDIDGSESIVSLKIVNVPEGFIIDGADNNGGGEWSVAVPPGSDSFDLSSLGLIPPKDFSGSVALDLVVFSKEDSLELPVENTATFTVVVNPIADRVDIDVTPTGEGTEDDNIDLILNIEAFDDSDSYTGTGTNVSENPPETLQIQISNVPDSSQIALPDGVTGTVTDQGSGVWLVTVDNSDLDCLVFIPGDANSDNWNGQLDLEIRAVDQTDVATDDIAQLVTINLDIEAVNDAPVNQVPDMLEVDEDTLLLINSLQVTDVDVDEVSEGTMTVVLEVGNGLLSLPVGSPVGSLTITGENSQTLTLEGSITDINTLLSSGVNYQPDANFNGDDSLQITTDDQGNTGSGGPLQDTDTVPITVNPINDAPELPIIDDQTVEEDSPLVLNGLRVSDIDFDEAGSSGVMTVTVTANNGGLTAVETAGVTITDNGTEVVTLEGSLTDINIALAAGITYQANPDFKGDDVISVVANDNGNVGAGGPQQATTTINVTVTPKPEPPTLELTVPQLADTRATLNTLVPLLGLVVIPADADEALFLEVRNLGAGRLVDSSGAEIGTDNGDGSWRVASSDLDNIFVADLPEGANSLTLVGISQEIDGSEAESTELLIGVRIDDLANTGNEVGAGDNDAENLVLGSDADERLFGGLADDILVGAGGSDELFGGAGNDELWGGDLNGTGDGAADVFTWQAGDVSTSGTPFTDTVKDFEINLDQINIADILPDNGEEALDRLLNNIVADIDAENTVNLAISATETLQQNIAVENIDVAAIGLGTGSTSNEIINELFNNGVFIVD
ncbi:retention module-containing protein [Photobacterium satsumensis]|uniref:retention module-containing protein n=1 Tax=Photobacterium satsumensis TaxID=2910239 RepID=UPI003D0CF91A